MYQQIDFNAIDYSVLYNASGQLVQPTAIVGPPAAFEAIYPTPMVPYVARYHVGNSCRITESSILELPVGNETRYFKPLKCSGPYAIFERLPCENDYRVNRLLHHFGVIPVTLVRDIVEIEPIMEDHFISGPVGPSITCLMKTYALRQVEIVFGDKGLYIRPTGSKDFSKIDDCCRNAFALSNERTRCHKQLKPDKRDKKGASKILRNRYNLVNPKVSNHGW